jgi:hypothetical protein
MTIAGAPDVCRVTMAISAVTSHARQGAKGPTMSDTPRQTLRAWREAKQLTPEALAQAGAGIGPEIIQQWEEAGEPPAEAMPSLITVARALDVPLEQLDLGPNRRGFDLGGYTFVLFARGREERPWRARIGAWGWPADSQPADAIAERATSGVAATGNSAEAALDALEAELRELVRATAQEAAVGAGTEPSVA